MDIMLIQRAIENFRSIEELRWFLNLHCKNCEHFRDCDNQCGEDIWEYDTPKKNSQKCETEC